MKNFDKTKYYRQIFFLTRTLPLPLLRILLYKTEFSSHRFLYVHSSPPFSPPGCLHFKLSSSHRIGRQSGGPAPSVLTLLAMIFSVWGMRIALEQLKVVDFQGPSGVRLHCSVATVSIHWTSVHLKRANFIFRLSRCHLVYRSRYLLGFYILWVFVFSFICQNVRCCSFSLLCCHFPLAIGISLSLNVYHIVISALFLTFLLYVSQPVCLSDFHFCLEYPWPPKSSNQTAPNELRWGYWTNR